MFRALSEVWRLMRAGAVLARYHVALPAELLRAVPAPARMLIELAANLGPRPKMGGTNSERLSAALVALGPAYVKLGQFLATRPDILGPQLANDLKDLQDRMAPFPHRDAVAIIEGEFGLPLKDVFAEFGPAVAAASIAQVHRARIISTDDEAIDVAVKVLRPGIERAFRRDLEAFATAARLVEARFPASRRLEPLKLVATLRASVEQELDLRLEAAGASEMAESVHGSREFLVPAIDWTRTTRRVLTSAWVNGIPIADRSALIAKGYDLKHLARLVIHHFLEQAMLGGLFHADMHPGNLFVVPRQDDPSLPAIAAVDFGIIGRLDRSMRRFMAETLHGFLTRDYRRVAEAHFAVGFVPATHSTEDFALALRAIGEPVFGRAARDISMARLLQQLFEVTALFDMRLQPQLVLLQKTMVVVEGVARELDGDLDIWSAARAPVEAFMMRELGPEGRFQDAAEAAVSLARVARRAPQVLEKMESLADQLSLGGGEGLKLHPDTARSIAEAETRTTRHARMAIWIAAASLAAIAIAALGA